MVITMDISLVDKIFVFPKVKLKVVKMSGLHYVVLNESNRFIGGCRLIIQFNTVPRAAVHPFYAILPEFAEITSEVRAAVREAIRDRLPLYGTRAYAVRAA